MLELAIERYAHYPVKFVREVLNITPDAPQCEILNSVAQNRMTTVRSGHGVGKSAVESWLILWFLCTRPHLKIPCTAPTMHQLSDILWAEIAKWIHANPLLSQKLVWTRERVFMRSYPETWFAVARTATKPDALQGFHAEHVFYVIDEASGVDDSIFEPVLGSLTTPDVKLLMCGNPTRLSGFFHASHTKDRVQYDVHHVDGRNSPRVSPQFVQSILEMYGQDSDVFRVRVAGEFPKALADSFIAMDWCEKASERSETIDRPTRIDIGVDVARYGDDSSVLCTVFDKSVQLEPQIYHHNDTMQLTGHLIHLIKQLAIKYPNASIMVKIDCDGLGVGVYDRLNEQLDGLRREFGRSDTTLDAAECHFGGEGGKLDDGDPIEYANSTGLMWGMVREALRKGTLALHPSAQQISQLSNRKYTINSAGKIELERKESMKKRGLASPDIADALALAVYTPRKATFEMQGIFRPMNQISPGGLLSR